MDEQAKKLWARVNKKREELGVADFAVAQAEAARGAARQAAADAMTRFSEHVGELAIEQGLDPSTTPFNVERFEFDVPAEASRPEVQNGAQPAQPIGDSPS